MKSIGFKPNYLKEAETVTEQVKSEVVENLNVEAVGEMGLPPLSTAHKTLVARLAECETLLTSKKFSRFTAQEKSEYVNEYKWLVSLNIELGGG